jgi:Domain of unknown function (DUF5655)/Domain of unknown function (DUF4287)
MAKAGKAPAPKKSRYSVHPGVAMVQNWVATLKEKTGRSLEEWLALVKRSGPKTEKERREWLKKEHGLGTNSAGWIAERAEGRPALDADPQAYLQAAEGYVEKMLSGGRAPLQPVYEALLDLGFSLGPDVKACPCQTIVPLYRKHVFAQIKLSTRSRIDLGLALGDTKAPKRLIDTGGFAKKDRITHRIEVGRVADIDAEVRKWLKVAYGKDG